MSVLIRDGTLKKGDSLVAGQCYGRIRQLKTDQGKIVSEMKPGFPVEVIGFNELPQAGDSFLCCRQ